jgi:hypothetical protein
MLQKHGIFEISTMAHIETLKLLMTSVKKASTESLIASLTTADETKLKEYRAYTDGMTLEEAVLKSRIAYVDAFFYDRIEPVKAEVAPVKAIPQKKPLLDTMREQVKYSLGKASAEKQSLILEKFGSVDDLSFENLALLVALLEDDNEAL